MTVYAVCAVYGPYQDEVSGPGQQAQRGVLCGCVVCCVLCCVLCCVRSVPG